MEPPRTDPVVQVEGLDVSYGSVQVLFDCSIEVDAGETVVLLGTNGAGKSTLLRTILGLTPPDRGAVHMHGEDITRTRAEARFARGMVAVRGGDGVFAELSVEDNLAMSFTATHIPSRQRQQRVEHVLARFPALRDRWRRRAGDLSGGERQQLALARALVHEPEILMIDELSLGLAPVVVQGLIEVVESLRENGQTMLIVEQSMNIALTICHRALYMEKGRVVFDGSSDELLARGDLVDTVFLGAGPRP
jgi:ABC-type branched-subunit amino acid transport system ATPase component